MVTYAGGALSADFGAVNATAGYYNFKDILKKDSGIDNAIWFVGAGTTFGDFGLNAMYLKGDASYQGHDLDGLDDDGYTVGLTWKGAEAAKLVPMVCLLTTMIWVAKPISHTLLMQTPLTAKVLKVMA